jgi:hypothetical protein
MLSEGGPALNTELGNRRIHRATVRTNDKASATFEAKLRVWGVQSLTVEAAHKRPVFTVLLVFVGEIDLASLYNILCEKGRVGMSSIRVERALFCAEKGEWKSVCEP